MHGCRAALAGMAAALALAAAGPAAGASDQDAATVAGPAPRMAAAKLERSLLQRMNRVRRAHGRPRLRAAAPLRRPARAHSRWMLRTGDLIHESGDGSPFWTRLVAAGYPRTRRMGENLAMVSGCDARAARRIVALWMRSPGHRANLLDRRYRRAGVGVAVARDCSATWVTADFGS